MTVARAYEGDELDLFLAARHRKAYWSRKIRPHIGDTVLEVGAGFWLVTNSPWLDPLLGFQLGKTVVGVWTK